MTYMTTLIGGPNDGQKVEDDGRPYYQVLIVERPELTMEADFVAKPTFRIGVYDRKIRARDHQAVYVWQNVNTDPRPR